MGGGHGGGSSAGASGGGGGTSNTNNISPGSNIGGTDGQGTGGNSGNTPVATPEPTTMFLLGSALLGLWGLRRKIKK